ncbi:hypothetical protein TI04_08585, partial [Achromatium sp. WMS2]
VSSKQSAQQAQAASEGTQSVLKLAEEGSFQVQEMLQGMEELRSKEGAIAQPNLYSSHHVCCPELRSPHYRWP